MLSSVPFMITFAIICSVIATTLYKKCAGTLSPHYPNVVSLVYYSYIFCQVIASFLIGVGLVNTWWMNRAENQIASTTIAFYATFISFLLLPIFINLIQHILHLIPKYEYLSLYRKKWTTLTGKKDEIVIIFLLLSSVVLTFFLLALFKMTGDIPLWHLFSGAGADELAILRHSTSVDIGWGIYINNIVGRWFSPFVALVCFCYYLLKRKKLYLLLFLYTFAITCLFLFYSLAKAPILLFFIMIYICYSIYKGKINFFALFWAFVIILVFILVMWVAIIKDSDLDSVTKNLVNRIFFSQYAGTVLTFDYFPKAHDYIYGVGFIPFASKLFMRKSTSFALLLMEHYNPSSWQQGKVGYLASQYIAEGYANFGYIGIIMANVLVALWISITNFFSLRLRYHPISIAIITILMVYIPVYMNSGVKVFIYNPPLILLFGIILLLIFLSRGKLNIKLQRRMYKIQ